MKEILTYKKSNGKPEHPDANDLARYAEFLRHETDEVPDELVEHVSSCNFCKSELMAITDLLDTLPDLDVAEEPAATTSMPRRPFRTPRVRWIRAIVSVAAIVLLAWIVVSLLPEKPLHAPIASSSGRDSVIQRDAEQPANLPARSDSTAKNRVAKSSAEAESNEKTPMVSDTIRYAQSFSTHPVYENLVSAKYRSGNDPKVQGPVPGAIFSSGDTLKISWTPDPNDQYQLVILDNLARQVKEIKGGSEGFLIWPLDLKPGLYYWKLLGRDEMWKVGKIKIINSR